MSKVYMKMSSKVLETWLWERSYHSGGPREIVYTPVMGEIDETGDFEKLFRASAVIGREVYKSGRESPTMEEAKASLAARMVSEAGTVLSSSDD